MKNIYFTVFYCIVITVVVVYATDEELIKIDKIQPPAKPYAFGYAAGRFPGHIDRTHSEVSDGSGVVQGSYSYVDPSYKIHKVDYTADKNGFHPILNQNPSALPADTPIVAAAKEKHLLQFARIADSHHDIVNVQQPVQTYAVQAATNQHLSLFQKIANEHAQIADERKNQQPEDYSNYVNY